MFLLLLLCVFLRWVDLLIYWDNIKQSRSLPIDSSGNVELWIEPTMLVLRDAVQRRDDYIRLVVESIAEMREPVFIYFFFARNFFKETYIDFHVSF